MQRVRGKDKVGITTIAVIFDVVSIIIRNLLVTSQTESCDCHDSKSLYRLDDYAYSADNDNIMTAVSVIRCGDSAREKNRDIYSYAMLIIAAVIVGASSSSSNASGSKVG